MRIHSEREISGLCGGQEFHLAPGFNEVPDHVGEHALRKYAPLGVRRLTPQEEAPPEPEALLVEVKPSKAKTANRKTGRSHRPGKDKK